MSGQGKHGERGRSPRGDHGRFDEVRDGIASRYPRRLFEQGDLKLVILDFINCRPRHGYEIIKAIEEMAGGEYSPSPGVVYPTLSLLEEAGHAAVAQENGGKKQYGITPEGAAYLTGQEEALRRIRQRVESAVSAGYVRRAPELQRSLQNFHTALNLRLGRGPVDTDQLRKIADIIDRAAVNLERS
jgi:DNA-binding PadR family transcriptional regulator